MQQIRFSSSTLQCLVMGSLLSGLPSVVESRKKEIGRTDRASGLGAFGIDAWGWQCFGKGGTTRLPKRVERWIEKGEERNGFILSESAKFTTWS